MNDKLNDAIKNFEDVVLGDDATKEGFKTYEILISTLNDVILAAGALVVLSKETMTMRMDDRIMVDVARLKNAASDVMATYYEKLEKED